MEDTTTATPALAPRIEHTRRLAEIIREVHGSTITVDALALAILSHPGFSSCHDGPAPAPEAGEVEDLVEFLCAFASSPILTDPVCVQLRRTAEILKGIPALPVQGDVERLVAALHHLASDAREAGMITVAECLTRTATLLQQQPTTPPPLPSDYIDADHQGKDRELLEAFYRATNAEGGTADEIHLRGIRAVLALRPSVAAVRAADAAISDEAIEAEFRAWWKAHVHPLNAPRYHAVTTHVAWGRHLLSRGGL